MENRNILICDTDYAYMNELESQLENNNFNVDTLDVATDLIPSVIRFRPNVVLVNPDMEGFNEYDVCKYVIRDLQIPVILLLSSHSAHRAQIDECHADDVVTRPAEINNLVALLLKHITVHQ